jgi:NitT/TauT family transport system substrate-binding protein
MAAIAVRFRLSRLVPLVLLLAMLPACGGKAAGVPHPARSAESVTVDMGYFPDVQFAPFYVAVEEGYYRQAGLTVHFNYGIEPQALALASTGKVDMVDSGGDSVLEAAAQGLHVTYVMTQYSRFPSALFALHSTGIRNLRGLRGRSIGVPGLYGASYVGLLVALQRAGLSASSVSIRSIGFTQVASVAHHKVDAAVGYAMNEPVQLRREGYRVDEFDIYRYANIAGAGLAAGNDFLRSHPAAVRAFVRATLRGLALAIRDPGQAFRLTLKAVPALRAQAASQRAVLARAIDFWRPETGHRLGWVDPAVWTLTANLLARYRQIGHPVSPRPFYTNEFIP